MTTWRFLIIALASILHDFCFTTAQCLPQELSTDQLVILENDGFAVLNDSRLVFWRNTLNSDSSIELPLKAEKLLRVHNSKLLLLVGRYEDTALVDYETRNVRMLPSQGKYSRACCATVHKETLFIGYQPPQILPKITTESLNEVQMPSSLVVSAARSSIKEFMVEGKELKYHSNSIPQLNPYWMRNILFIGDSQCFEVTRSFIKVELNQRIPHTELSVVEVSGGVVRTIFKSEKD